MPIAAIIAWILANPQIVMQGAQVIVNMIKAVIAAWERHQQGELTDEQLQAAWTAEGIKVQDAIDAWNAAGQP